MNRPYRSSYGTFHTSPVSLVSKGPHLTYSFPVPPFSIPSPGFTTKVVLVDGYLCTKF